MKQGQAKSHAQEAPKEASSLTRPVVEQSNDAHIEGSSSLPSEHSVVPLHIPYAEMHWSKRGHFVCTVEDAHNSTITIIGIRVWQERQKRTNPYALTHLP